MESNNNAGNTKRLAVNTIFLYIRSFITMLIALYTSRVVLASLGVDDYGLYNVVGGVVSLITIVVSGLSSSTQRFLSYELGRGDRTSLNNVFNVCVNTHIAIAGFFLLLALTIGLWFVNNCLEIPLGRESAAIWVFLFSSISIVINVIIAPFQGLLISHEKLNIYAYLGILDAVLKLGIAYIISKTKTDRLILYGFLLLLISLFNFIFYFVYCRIRYQESHYRWVWDKPMFKRILSFASWTVVGQGAMVGANQGTNILINIFHSVRANAAMGVATQVNGALSTLTSNFFVAYQPQIVKSYAQHDYQYMTKLIHGASKLSFFLLFIVSLPIILNLDQLLSLWLTNVPDDTNIFCFFFILSSIINALGNPAWTGVNATGNNKKMNLYSTILYALDLLIIFVLFKLGFPAYAGPATKVVIDCGLTCLRFVCLKNEYGVFSLRGYFLRVILPLSASVLVVITSTIALIKMGIVNNRVILSIIVVIIALLSSYYIGLSGQEKRLAQSYLRRVINYHHNREGEDNNVKSL